jgi:protein-disulfide isomerase
VETGRVRFYFRHFPLPNHQFARSAAIGAHCAGEQGRFWPLYERVYRLQPRLDDAGLRAAARKVGVDIARWSRCVADDRASEAVDADFEAGRELELHGTPTFLIGTIQADGRLQATTRLYGAQGFDAFEKAIAEAEEALGKLSR